MKTNRTISFALSIIMFAGFFGAPASLYSQAQKGELQKDIPNSDYVFLPILSYSPETKLAGGAMHSTGCRQNEPPWLPV